MSVLTASACLPAVFPPVALGGWLHVDGGVTCPVPVERALDLGARRIWVLDVSGGAIGRRDDRMTALDVLLLSFAISRSHLDRAAAPEPPGQASSGCRSCVRAGSRCATSARPSGSWTPATPRPGRWSRQRWRASRRSAARRLLVGRLGEQLLDPA